MGVLDGVKILMKQCFNFLFGINVIKKTVEPKRVGRGKNVQSPFALPISAHGTAWLISLNGFLPDS